METHSGAITPKFLLAMFLLAEDRCWAGHRCLAPRAAYIALPDTSAADTASGLCGLLGSISGYPHLAIQRKALEGHQSGGAFMAVGIEQVWA